MPFTMKLDEYRTFLLSLDYPELREFTLLPFREHGREVSDRLIMDLFEELDPERYLQLHREYLGNRSEDEIRQILAKSLPVLESPILGRELFDAIMDKVGSVAYTVVPIDHRKDTGRIRVHLCPRAQGEAYNIAGETVWYAAGSFLRRHEDATGPLQRVAKQWGNIYVDAWKIGSFVHPENRTTLDEFVLTAEVQHENHVHPVNQPTIGYWQDVEYSGGVLLGLPEGIIEHHVPIYTSAVASVLGDQKTVDQLLPRHFGASANQGHIYTS